MNITERDRAWAQQTLEQMTPRDRELVVFAFSGQRLDASQASDLALAASAG